MATGKYQYPPTRRKRRKRSPLIPILILVLALLLLSITFLRKCGANEADAPQTQPSTEAAPEPEVTTAPTEPAPEEPTEAPTEPEPTEPAEEPTEPVEETTEPPTEPVTEPTEPPAISTEENKALGQQMADVAAAQIGKPYALGGRGPDAFDTSGFLVYCYGQVSGESLSNYTSEQAKTGSPVEKDNLQPGDVVFFWSSNPGEVEYQGIYIGDGKFVAARNPEHPVSKMEMNSESFKERYLFARRSW